MVEFKYDINNKYATIIPNIIASGKELGFFNADGTVAKYITDKLHEDERGNVCAGKHLFEVGCSRGGYDKTEFVNFQVLVYKLKTLIDAGEFAVDVYWKGRKMTPGIGKNKRAETDDVIKDIKKAKRRWDMVMDRRKVWKCPLKPRDLVPGMIHICCVCVAPGTILLKNT